MLISFCSAEVEVLEMWDMRKECLWCWGSFIITTCSVTCVQCVCLTNFIWRSTSIPKCHVTFSKTKMNVNGHLHMLLKCHLNVTCLVVCVISISKVLIDIWFFSSQVIHYMSKSKLCVSIDMHFIFVQVFVCQMPKTCNNSIKNTHCMCPSYGPTI